MDKFMSSTWFVRGASFAIAILLFISVNFEFKSDKKVLEVSTLPEINSETIENVPVEVYYDTENLVVNGIPDSVDVTLKGAKSLLTAAKNQRDFTVYVDLSDPNITLGKRTVTFKITNLNEKLIATIDPEYVQVTIQERVTKEFSVEAEYDHSVLEDGYFAEDPVVKPEKVKITGAKELIDQISYVKAIIDLDKGVKETVRREASIQALDRNLNKLDVTIEPASVDVTLKVSIPNKKVKINPVQTGKVKDGLTIKSISAEPEEVTLYGKQEELDKIKQINLDVDVTDVIDDTEVTLSLPELDSIKDMSTSTVKVKIKTEKEDKEESKEAVDKEESTEESKEAVNKEESTEENKEAVDKEEEKVDNEASVSSKKIEGLPIGINGEDNNQIIDINPKVTDITLLGKTNDLQNITEKDIEVSVDIRELTEGEHDVQLSVKAPTTVEWELSSPTVTILITRREET